MFAKGCLDSQWRMWAHGRMGTPRLAGFILQSPSWTKFAVNTWKVDKYFGKHVERRRNLDKYCGKYENPDKIAC